MENCDTEKLIQDLKGLYSQNLVFISSVENGTSKKNYDKEHMNKFKELNIQLNEYIEKIEKGEKPNKNLQVWCIILGNALLDDDNFYIEEDGFQWL